MVDDPNGIRYTVHNPKIYKGDHLAHQAIEDYQSIKFDFPDEDIMKLDNVEDFRPYDGPEQRSRWTLYFDGASNALENGIGAVLISPEGCNTPFTTRICFSCTNNMSEYEACFFGLKAAIDLGIKSSIIFGDSALVISQIKGEWDTKHPNLIPYKERLDVVASFRANYLRAFPARRESVGRRIG